jgi:hypothetical protein
LVAALMLQARSRSTFFPPRESLSSLPMQIGDGWTGQDISLDQLPPQEVLLREYQNANRQNPPVVLFIDYVPSGNGAQIHSEWKHCLPGAGWVPTLREVVEIPRPDGSSFLANRYVLSKEGNRELVLNWYQAHGRAVASIYRQTPDRPMSCDPRRSVAGLSSMRPRLRCTSAASSIGSV